MKSTLLHWFQPNGLQLKKLFSHADPLPSIQPEDTSVTPLGPAPVKQEVPRPVARPKTRPSDIKVAIIGNCQAFALANCINAITRGVAATGNQIFTMAPTPEEIDLSSILADNDILLLHPHHILQKLVDSKYPRERNRIKTIPAIALPAYHPDLVYINGPGDRKFMGPLGHYNSSIAFYGWVRGLNAAQILELFTREVYQKLGFFDYWQSSRDALLNQAKMFGYSLDDLFDRWARRGCFMHTVNHPKYFAIADLARMVLSGLGISNYPVGEEFVRDHFLDGPVWPVYPEIGKPLGIDGHYFFKRPKGPANPVMLLDLEEFVRESLQAFSMYGKEDLVCDRLNTAPYRELDNLIGMRTAAKPVSPQPKPKAAAEAKRRTPYDGLPNFHFWRKAVSGIASDKVDPVVSAGFKIGRETKVATAGSCFAQHISRKLQQQGFNYYIAEKPPGISAEEAGRLNYGVFSARYGNVYTARQFLQLFDRAFGTFQPFDSAWLRADGRYADPFRPRVEPDGFATAEEVENSRNAHLTAVREMFQNLDVLVFTLGLTEAWAAKKDGAVFPLAPGVSAGEMDFSLYEFVNFSAAQVQADLEAFVERLSSVNGTAKIIFTVSPVPLIATFENRHVLLSTIYSKSVLRVAAEEVVGKYPNCFYFPAYEIITGNFNRGEYFENDLRSVNDKGVDHAMRLFFAHYSAEEGRSALYETLLREAESIKDIICDEEEIDAAGSA